MKIKIINMGDNEIIYELINYMIDTSSFLKEINTAYQMYKIHGPRSSKKVDIIPHMGWNELKVENDSKVFKDVANKNHAYFIHSYEFIPNDKKTISITTDYGKDIIAAVSFENIYGSQFHPEKSQKTGIKILTNFLNL